MISNIKKYLYGNILYGAEVGIEMKEKETSDKGIKKDQS